MKSNRFLAMLCLVCLCFMNLGIPASGLADSLTGSAAKAGSQSALEAVPNKKSKKDGKSLKEETKATKKPKATKTPKPTKEPKPTKTPKVTKEPEATKKPKKTEAPEEPEATKKPKKTEAPEEPEATKKPKKTEEPEAPEEPEATKKPKKTEEPEATKEPKPTKEPEEAEPTEEPEEAEPTEEPEPTKAPKLKLKGLKADKKEVAPGDTLGFTLTVENAETVVWNAQRSDGENGGSGKVKNGSFKWKPKVSGVYTVTVNATAGEQTVSDSCTVIVRASKLKVTAKAETDYAQQGGKKLKYSIAVEGGCEPYTMEVAIKYKGKEIFTSKEFLTKVECKAEGYGDNKLTVVVTDALGKTAKGKATILSASNEKNEAPALPKLKSDMTFAEKVVAVAKSQQGYRESKENFIIRDDDSVQGWSFYGGWYGAPYEEWCAMFVSYCLVKSGIGEDIMPHSGNCNRWKGELGTRYIDDEDTYFPEPGDIIFFHHDRVSKDPNYPNHIGIVTQYDAETDTVYTVEGNSGKSVRARQYAHDSSVIVGYASMRECMVLYDKTYKSQLGDQLADKLARFRDSLTGEEEPVQAAEAD